MSAEEPTPETWVGHWMQRCTFMGVPGNFVLYWVRRCGAPSILAIVVWGYSFAATSFLVLVVQLFPSRLAECQQGWDPKRDAHFTYVSSPELTCAAGPLRCTNRGDVAAWLFTAGKCIGHWQLAASLWCRAVDSGLYSAMWLCARRLSQ